MPSVISSYSGTRRNPAANDRGAEEDRLGSHVRWFRRKGDSLGEYGTHIKDVELRTGLTAKEVGQFSFAARVAGQDVQIFERMMRGLTMARSG